MSPSLRRRKGSQNVRILATAGLRAALCRGMALQPACSRTLFHSQLDADGAHLKPTSWNLLGAAAATGSGVFVTSKVPVTSCAAGRFVTSTCLIGCAEAARATTRAVRRATLNRRMGASDLLAPQPGPSTLLDSTADPDLLWEFPLLC